MKWPNQSLAAAAVVLAFCAGPVFGAEPIATADSQQSGLRVDITELKRTSGDTLMMKFTVVYETGDALDLRDSIFGAHSVEHVHLIDAVGKKKYLPVMDTQGGCVCSYGLPRAMKAGESISLWARFPAPPAEVKEVSVVFPKFIPTDAPISE